LGSNPTWKALPNRADIIGGHSAADSSIFNLLKYELAAFAENLLFVNSIQDGIFSHCSLWPQSTLWPFSYSWNTETIHNNCERFEQSKLPEVLMDLLRAFHGFNVLPGRLCQVFDGAGKRRIFAIGNYIKQRLLRPVHDWAMSVLKTLPTDGTYDQVRPLERLAGLGSNKFYCYDLSSATDRWPLSVIHEVVSSVFGPAVASCVVNAALGLNAFDISGILPKGVKSTGKRVCFTTGQPLGYYSSWPLFSLSHHYIVWVANENVYPGTKFTQYALLGDDIVIADELVAKQKNIVVFYHCSGLRYLMLNL